LITYFDLLDNDESYFFIETVGTCEQAKLVH